MGLNIGGTSGSLASLRSLPEFGQVRLGARREPISLPGSRATDDSRGPFFRGERPQPASTGFGQGLSTQGAALRTLSNTFEQTRRTIPTLEEIRERFISTSTARREETQRTAIGRTERSLTRRVESRIPDASAQARNFIGGLNEAAKLAQARLESFQAQSNTQSVDAADVESVEPADAPPPSATGPTIQINGQQIGFGTSENEVRLDLRV